MAPAPFGMTGQPGANFGGTQTGAAAPSGAVGGTSNPLLPTFPAGQTMGTSFPANTAGTTPTNLGGTGTPTSGPLGTGGSAVGGFGSSAFPNEHDFIKAMHKAGFSAGNAAMLWQFLKSGAGFNPQVAQALINSMQPQVQRGEADIMEQFSAMGLRNSSPAAIGLADFLSQVNLNEQEVFAKMYEQATQNYLAVLLSGKGPAPKSGFDMFMDIWRQLSANAQSAATLGAACWVAAALYGPNDIRTHLLRSWLLNVYQKTHIGRIVVHIYQRFGERIAKSRVALGLLRPLFNLGVRRAAAYYSAEAVL